MIQEKSICFYFPYKEESGVPVLFYRMANYISARYPTIEVIVVDYSDGAMARNIESRDNLKLIHFSDGKQVVIPENCLLVMQSFVPYYWPEELQVPDSARMFFWNLHPYNFIPSLLPFPYLRNVPTKYFRVYKGLTYLYPATIKRLRDFVMFLTSKHALRFMDKSNRDSTIKHLFLQAHDECYLPVPIDKIPPVNLKGVGFLHSSEIHITWLGRLCDFKVHILICFLKKLQSISGITERKIVCHIIGEGPLRGYLEKNVVDLKRIDIRFHGNIPHKKLQSFLLETTDIMAAMGTSALEGGALGIPTILLDASYVQVSQDYIFRLLSETEEFDLAHFVSASDFEVNNKSLQHILAAIISNYARYSNNVYNYVAANHSISSVAEKLLDAAGASELYFGDIDPKYFQKSRFLKFYNKLRGLPV